MPQFTQSYDEVKIPFQKMTFSPDVPPSALGPNEYNVGLNIETDVRGIRSVSGDEMILDGIPGTPTYITGGYRNGGEFWFIAATEDGKWWASNGVEPYADITPGFTPFQGYTQATNITDSWNGTVPVFNDGINPPFFFPDEPNDALGNPPLLVVYSNLIKPKGISNIAYYSPTEQILTFSTAYDEVPYVAGQKIRITDVNKFYNGVFTVTGCTTTDVVYKAQPGAAYPGGSVGTVSPEYTWNYDPNWKSLTAGFIRLYSSPNVGNVLVAGNLTYRPLQVITGDTTINDPVILTTSAQDDLVGATIDGPGIPQGSTIISVVVGVSVTIDNDATATATGVNLRLGLTPVKNPVTIQWSQAFGLNDMPRTWEPTILNVANQVEVPLRGEALDAFPCNGQLFICSYWDTVVMSPMNYATTSAPIFGIRLFNQGRGLLTANCWGNTDKLVYGFDARDIWVFDGQNFTGLGNQRVKNFFYKELDAVYFDRAYMEVNSHKNQVEIYYTTTGAVTSESLSGVAITGTAGQFSCTNNSLVVDQEILVSGTLSGTGSITGYTNPKTYYIIATNGTTTFTLSETVGGSAITTTAGTTTGLTFAQIDRGVPNKMLAYRYDIDCWNPPRDVSAATFACESPYWIYNNDTANWEFDPASRTVVYAQGRPSRPAVQKDIGYSFAYGEDIYSLFRRDNITLLKDYSGKLLVHRILPEIYNLDADTDVIIDPATQSNLIGTVDFTIEGANSVGQAPLQQTFHSIPTNTDDPWAQIDQNAHRVNSIKIANLSNDNIWMCTATTWQYTQTEDDR
jgi:hypothetical protein